MDIIILVVAMVVVGVIIGALAGSIFKGERPKGVQGDYIISIVTCVIVGLLDWYVIPAMGFGESLKYLGVALEPALGALLVLWLVRRANN
jgi:uncharacterized membrane protein YeaQ/YmgE (transglycosylase-associated protein family)